MVDWDALSEKVGGCETSYNSEQGQRALELLIGEETLLEATRGAIEMQPTWMLMEGILRILGSSVAIREAYRIYKTTSDKWEKGRAVSLMREIPNSDTLNHVPEFLEDPDVAVETTYLLEKQLWYWPGLASRPTTVALVELAERHPNAAVRQGAIAARAHLKANSSDESPRSQTDAD